MNADEREELPRRFEKFWSDIRGFHLYAGQPSTSESAAGVSLAREAFRLATEAADPELLLQAQDMLRYSLTANEQYRDALPYYEVVVSGYEARGDHAKAARVRIGYVEALAQSGRYDEALNVAGQAERWLNEQGDTEGYARLCTNVANLYSRLDQHKRSHGYYMDAVRVFQETGNRAALGQVYLNLGYVLYRLDDFEESDAMYERAEQAGRELQLGALEGQAKYN